MITIYQKRASELDEMIPMVDYRGNDLASYEYDYSGNYMADRKVVVKIQSPIKLSFEIGAFVTYRSHFFYLQNKPIAQRVYSSNQITYNLTFQSVDYELGLIAFQDVVDGDTSLYNNSGNLEVSVYGTVEQLLSRIIANTKRALTLAIPVEWAYYIHPSVDTSIVKDIVLTNAYCSDALALVKSLFGLDWKISHPRNILVGYPPEAGETVFRFGKDNGLCEINRIENDAKFITRAVGFGSNRNIPTDYRVDETHKYNPRLMLPEATGGYLEDAALVALYGVREGIYPTNEEIYPSITGATYAGLPIDEVISVEAYNDKDSTRNVIVTPAWTEAEHNPDTLATILYHPAVTTDVKVTASTTVSFLVNNPGFNVFDDDILTSSPPKISFTTGMMQGVEFKILAFDKYLVGGVWTDGLYRVTIERDSSDVNHVIPNLTTNIESGDKFVYLDIFLPETYITEAELRLQADMQTWLDSQKILVDGYSIRLTEEHLERNPELPTYIYEGNAILIEDTELDAAEQAILIQSLNISHRPENILPTYTLTVSPQPIKGQFYALQSQLKNAILNAGSQKYVTETQIKNVMKSAYFLERKITTTNQYVDGRNIAPQTIENNSLSINLRGSNYMLQAYLTVNYGGDANSAYGSAGTLIHKDADIVWGGINNITHQTWTIASPQTFTSLDPDTLYWAYIKCDLSDGSAIWVLSDTKVGVVDLEGYYMFEWGQVFPVVGGERISQTSYGVTNNPSGNDEKVKYDAADPTAGYLADKIIAGANITVEEGTGADENKVKISAVIPEPEIAVAPEYGNHYNWWVTQEDVAPTGWHIPSETEWETLKSYLGGASVAGGKLKETGIGHWESPNVGATNESGFYGIGSGERNISYETSFFAAFKSSAHFWSSLNDGINSKMYGIRSMDATLESIESISTVEDENSLNLKKSGHPLRFVKDDSTDPDSVTDYDGNVYATVKIGDQVWMAENFRGIHYNDGSPIDGPDFTDEEWSALTTPAYCVYKQTVDEKIAQIEHNSLLGKQGGSEEDNEFYHLTADEYAKVQALGIEDISFEFADIIAGTAKDYTLDIKASYAYTILSACLETDNGTLTGVAVKIGSTAVTSLSSVTVDTAVDETSATGANTVSIGDRVYLSVSTGYTGTPTLIRGKLKIQRT